MKGITAFWLGIPIIEQDGHVINFETRKAVAILAYLGLSSPNPSTREKLATLFWPEYDQQHAFANLRRALYSINRALGPDFIISDREKVMINPSCPFWQDISEIRVLLADVKEHNHPHIVCAECIDNLEKAITYYRGDFLEGLNLPDSPEFDNWQYLERESFLQDLFFSLEKLVNAYISLRAWEKAIQKSRIWVNLDQFNEKAQRTLIELYVQTEQRSSAINQIEEYSRILNVEFGQPLNGEMKEFYLKIKKFDLKNKDTLPGISPSTSHNQPSSQPLIKTKLFIPQLRDDYISRPQLVEKLDKGSKKTLTLVSAPTGYGKTTLLAEWINSLKTVDAPAPWAICWFSLDAGDNDPMRFLAYLTAALEKVDLELSAETQEIIRSSESTYPNTPLAMLLNDLQDQDQSVLLVLDDYQFINNPAIHDGIGFLLDHLPENVHVVIATRSDPPIPLSRLRARDQLSEIRADDLRFNTVETTRFLNHVFYLDLSQEQVEKLENHTEGWIAGLQLAAVSMQGRQDIPKFIETFSGSHRFIMDYLAEEALSRQPLEIQRYLLQTSILERLNDSLCDFVLNTHAKNLESTPLSPQAYSITPEKNKIRLAKLENLGLFIIPQDDDRFWYRYHHLFADLLRTRLKTISPDLVPELHQRASLWFENHGDVEASIDHSIAALDWDIASRLIKLHISKYLEKGQMTTIIKWIDEIPQEVILRDPKLCVEIANLYAEAGLIEKIDPLLNCADECIKTNQILMETSPESSEPVLSQSQITQIQSMIGILRALKEVCSGNPEAALKYTLQAVEKLPGMQPKELALLNQVEGWIYRSLGNLPLALTRLQKAIKFAREASMDSRDIWTDYGNLIRLSGKLPQAMDIFVKSINKAEERGTKDQGNLSRDEAFLSLIFLEQNRLDLALTHINRAIAYTQWWPSHNVIAIAYAVYAQVLLALEDIAGSVKAVEKAEGERKNRLMTPYIHSLIETIWVGIWLAQNKWDVLDRWSNDQVIALANKISKDTLIDEFLELRLIILVRVWVEKTRRTQKEERYQESLSILERLELSSRSSGRWNSLVVVLLYKAIVLFQIERRRDAFRELDDCFQIAEPGSYIRIFLDIGASSQVLFSSYLQQSHATHKKYALRILKEFNNPPSGEQQKDIIPESLTSRENDILQLLAQGYSNREMAERLVLSEGTIKFHVHNILGKLNAASRTQAIANARELNLI